MTTIPENFARMVSLYGDRPAVSVRAPYNNKLSTSSLNLTDNTSKTLGRETHFSFPPWHTLTYSELEEASSHLANVLVSQCGVQKGTKVAVSLGNTMTHVILTYAIFKVGAVLAPLNPAFTGPQVEAALNKLGVEVLVMGQVTDLAYKPRRGRGNERILEYLLGKNELIDEGFELGRKLKGKKKGWRTEDVKSAAVSSLKKVVIVDNVGDHDEISDTEGIMLELKKRKGVLDLHTVLQKQTASEPCFYESKEFSDPHDVINVQFTSGTTAHPKAAQLTHRGILNNGFLIGHRMGLKPGDSIVVPPPLFHCFGSVLGLMATHTHGAHIVFPSPAFDPRATLTAVREWEAEGCYGVGTMMVAILELLTDARAAVNKDLLSPETGVKENNVISTAAHATKSQGKEEEDLEKALWARHDYRAHLRKGIVAGSLVQQTLMSKLLEELGFEDLVICYGMTETSPVSLMTTPQDPLDKRTGSVGRVMPHTRIRVVEPENKTRVLERGKAGELAVSGYGVMKGYFGERELTEEVFLREKMDEGSEEEKRVWMHTGDEAVMDEDGYVKITGRIKDMIIRGGENIHPIEIENVLFAHPKVLEASVVGVRDEKHGEAVAAFVIVPHGMKTMESHKDIRGEKKDVLTKEEIRDCVRQRLSAHQVPKYVFWINEYPKTASGKIQKFKLKEMAEKMLGDGQ